MDDIGTFLLKALMYWALVLAAVATHPIIAGAIFVVIIAGMVMLIRQVGWLWSLGALTLLGLALGPALILTPVILVVKGFALVSSRIPGSETTHAPRPILLEPRVADQNR
jgi:hypothetical protein